MAEITNNRLDKKNSNSSGNLTLSSPYKVNSSTNFKIRDGDSEFGTTVATINVTPLVLNNVRLFGDDEVVKGDTLLLTAQIVPSTSVSDLSGYSIVFSGAVSGTYNTDRNGQVNLYYTGQGTGSKTVTVTAGNWSASKTFNDVITYWNTPNSKYPEKYTYNHGFSKLSQYYSLDTSAGNSAMVCIGDYSTAGNWELSFRVISKVTDVYFDIFTWSGNPPTFTNITYDRLVTFNANDIIKATCVDGTLTVTRNNVSLFTKTVNSNQFPGIFIMTQLPTGANIVTGQTNAGNVKTLNFNELKLMGL